MNDRTVELLITNLPAIIGALALFVASIVGTVLTVFTFRRAGRAEMAADAAKVLAAASVEQSQSNAVKIAAVGVAVDGKMEKLLQVSTAKAHAEGVKQEVDAQRDIPMKVEIVESPVPVKVVEEGK